MCFADTGRVEFAQKNVSDLAKLSFSFNRPEFEVDSAIPMPAL